MLSRKFCALAALAALACAVLPAWAQVTIPQEYDKLITQHSDIAVFDTEGFGDKIDLNSGGLQIVQTDVDLPGTSGLPVRITRRFATGDRFSAGQFGLWNLDVPYAHGVFGNHANNPKGWTVGGMGTDVYKRCSKYAAPLTLFLQNGVFEPDEYWHGNFLHMPGGGDEEMLDVGALGAHVPSDGSSYTVVTRTGAAMRCVPLAATSEAGTQGEGFEVVFRDGTVYTLNQMVSRTNEIISKPIDQYALRAGSSRKGIVVTPQAATTFTLPRVEVLIYPTKATDRFGNTVTYIWSTTNPWQLLQITASDGRQLTLTYESSTSRNVSSVTDGARTWSYATSGGNYTVTQPNGSTWVSNLSDLFGLKMSMAPGAGCGAPSYLGTPPVLTGTLQAPTGAIATFTMQPVRLGRSWVAYDCVYSGSDPLYAIEPISYYSLSIISKKITAPGLPEAGLMWTYTRGPENACWSSACTTSSPISRMMLMTAPDGDVTRYSFGNKFMDNEGQLLKVEFGWNGSSPLRTVDTTYASGFASPYSTYYGGSLRQRGDNLTSSYVFPQRKVVTTQQGRTFTWEVAAGCNGYAYCFDTFARPTRVVKSSAP